jgi:hypothetical protein
MRRFALVSTFLLLCLAASNASAGRIFGDIKTDGKPVAEGLQVKIAAPGGADATVTDKFGSYKLMAKGEGKCALTLMYANQPVSLDVFSYAEATRYDLILEIKDGKPSLKRK